MFYSTSSNYTENNVILNLIRFLITHYFIYQYFSKIEHLFSVANRAFNQPTWVNDKRHSWKEWRYGHSSLAVDGNSDNSLPNCAIMDNYYVDKPVWMVDLGKSNKVNGVIVHTWQGAGQGKLLFVS